MCVMGWSHGTVWRLDGVFVESLPCFHLYVGSRNQTQVARLGKWVHSLSHLTDPLISKFSPAKCSPCDWLYPVFVFLILLLIWLELWVPVIYVRIIARGVHSLCCANNSHPSLKHIFILGHALQSLLLPLIILGRLCYSFVFYFLVVFWFV